MGGNNTKNRNGGGTEPELSIKSIKGSKKKKGLFKNLLDISKAEERVKEVSDDGLSIRAFFERIVERIEENEPERWEWFKENFDGFPGIINSYEQVVFQPEIEEVTSILGKVLPKLEHMKVQETGEKGKDGKPKTVLVVAKPPTKDYINEITEQLTKKMLTTVAVMQDFDSELLRKNANERSRLYRKIRSQYFMEYNFSRGLDRDFNQLRKDLQRLEDLTVTIFKELPAKYTGCRLVTIVVALSDLLTKKDPPRYFSIQPQTCILNRTLKNVQFWGEVNKDGVKEGLGIEYLPGGGAGAEVDSSSKKFDSKLRFVGLFANGLRNGPGIEFPIKPVMSTRSRGDSLVVSNEGLRGVWTDGALTAEFSTNDLPVVEFETLRRHIRPLGIGQGGEGEVRLTLWNDKKCCVKMFFTQNKVSESLIKEVRIISGVMNECPYIIKLLGYFYDYMVNDNIGYIMEHCELGSVADLISRVEIVNRQRFEIDAEKRKKEILEKVPIDVSCFKNKLHILYQTALAVEHLHKNHILHLDLKWENVVLKEGNEGENPEVRLIDFGLADHQSFFTGTKEDPIEGFQGTFFLAAPEVIISSHDVQPDKKSDVFSFGIMIFQLLVLTLDPFRTNFSELDDYGERVALSREFCNRYADNPDLRPDFSNFPTFQLRKSMKWLINLMEDCWDQSKEKRPTMEEVRNIIEKHLKDGDLDEETLEKLEVEEFERKTMEEVEKKYHFSEILKKKKELSKKIETEYFNEEYVLENSEKVRAPTKKTHPQLIADMEQDLKYNFEFMEGMKASMVEMRNTRAFQVVYNHFHSDYHAVSHAWMTLEERKSCAIGSLLGQKYITFFGGCMRSKVNARRFLKDGLGMEFHVNGRLKFFGNFRGGMKQGRGFTFDTDGKSLGVSEWMHDEKIDTMGFKIPIVDIEESRWVRGIACIKEGCVSVRNWNGKLYAAKRYKAEAVKETEIKARCYRMMSVAHPNVVELVGYFPGSKLEGKTVLMEYCDCGSVSGLIKKPVKSKVDLLLWEEKVKALYDVVKAMEFVHGKGFVHFDLNWNNVLYCSSKKVFKVNDFDTMENVEHLTDNEFKLRGTHSYIAPEIVNAHASYDPQQAAEFDKGYNGSESFKCDIFSFGIMIFTLLALVPNEDPYVAGPFPSVQKAFEFCKTYSQEIEEEDDVFDSVDGEEEEKEEEEEEGKFKRPKFSNFNFKKEEKMQWLIDLMQKCWQHDPSQRPASFSEIRKCFEQNVGEIVAEKELEVEQKNVGENMGVGDAKPSPSCQVKLPVDE